MRITPEELRAISKEVEQLVGRHDKIRALFQRPEWQELKEYYLEQTAMNQVALANTVLEGNTKAMRALAAQIIAGLKFSDEQEILDDLRSRVKDLNDKVKGRVTDE